MTNRKVLVHLVAIVVFPSWCYRSYFKAPLFCFNGSHRLTDFNYYWYNKYRTVPYTSFQHLVRLESQNMIKKIYSSLKRVFQLNLKCIINVLYMIIKWLYKILWYKVSVKTWIHPLTEIFFLFWLFLTLKNNTNKYKKV